MEMGKYNLPKISNNHRWYLARHSKKYGCLKLQKDTWRGWVDVAEELVAITGQPFPVDIAVKQAAEDIVRIVEAPEIEYGVIS